MSDLSLIKELREKTGAGFLDCKNALNENGNNIEQSIDSLRKKGLAKATKKSSREANEGAVGFFKNENISVILKINSETDFSAKSDTFLDFLDNIGDIALKANNPNLKLNDFLKVEDSGKSISDLLTEMIAKIGENLIINDLKVFDNKENKVNYYVHNPYRKNIGKIVSAVFYSSVEENNDVKIFSKNLCMHIAASKPEAMDIDKLPADLIESEKKIQEEMIKDSGKPSNVMEKILDGKMKKFYSEVTLLNQNFVIDTDKTVKEAISDFNSSNSLTLQNYILISL
ncbi:translation elongation factor Ts [Alphaproteobacteria bacterium]|jgi:elongation factor Ts|nr:translation elongation factor Ts [Alphaproteobacteria bacterium]